MALHVGWPLQVRTLFVGHRAFISQRAAGRRLAYSQTDARVSWWKLHFGAQTLGGQTLETLWIDFVDKFHVPFWQILRE